MSVVCRYSGHKRYVPCLLPNVNNNDQMWKKRTSNTADDNNEKVDIHVPLIQAKKKVSLYEMLLLEDPTVFDADVVVPVHIVNNNDGKKNKHRGQSLLTRRELDKRLTNGVTTPTSPLILDILRERVEKSLPPLAAVPPFSL